MSSLSKGKKILKEQGLSAFLKAAYGYINIDRSPRKALWYYLNRIFRRNKEVVREIQGSKMILNLRDRGINAQLFVDGIREPECTRFLQSIMKPDWVMVEAGANIGYYALQEAKRVKKVYAIEPDYDNNFQLWKNVRLNGYNNVDVILGAVGSYDGFTSLEQSEFSNCHRVTNEKKICLTGSRDVRMHKLDTLLKNQKIDFLRMDVEGYEMEILKGARELIKTNNLGMFIEVHRDLLKDYGSSCREIISFLAYHDFWVRYCLIDSEQWILNYPIRQIISDDNTFAYIKEKLLLPKDTSYSLFVQKGE